MAKKNRVIVDVDWVAMACLFAIADMNDVTLEDAVDIVLQRGIGAILEENNGWDIRIIAAKPNLDIAINEY